MATRIIAAWYFLHQDEGYPNATVSSFDLYNPLNQEVNAQSDHYLIVREIGAAGTVLLKNEGALPLCKPKNIVLVGSDAAPPTSGPNEYTDQGGDPSGILAMGWGSGIDNFTYLVSPYEAVQARATVWIRPVFSGTLMTETSPRQATPSLAWKPPLFLLTPTRVNNNTVVVTNPVGPLIIEP